MGRLARMLIVVSIAMTSLAVAIVGPFGSRGGAPLAPATVPSVSAFLGAGGAPSLDRTIEALHDRVRRFPGDADAWASLGTAYLQRARASSDAAAYERAESSLRRSHRIRPDSPDAIVGLAALAAAEHDFSGALRLGRRARALDPHDPNAHGIVGDALIELGRYDAAFASLQRMVDLRPDTASLARVSYARELIGDVAGAIAAMRRARTYAGTPVDAAWTSFHLGVLELGSGRVRAAAGAFREAARLDRASAQPLVGLSSVALARGDLRRARSLIDEAMTRTPAPEHAIAAGELAILAGDDVAAARALEVARAGFRLLADAGVDVSLELALFEADHGDPARALDAARDAWAERRSVHAADAMAWALHVNARDRAAARFARLSRSLGTREGLFLYHAGAIEVASGRRALGRHLLRRAIEVDPWFSILGRVEALRLLGAGGTG